MKSRKKRKKAKTSLSRSNIRFYEKEKLIEQLTREMKSAAKMLEFEHAAYLRDRIEKLRKGK